MCNREPAMDELDPHRDKLRLVVAALFQELL